MFGSPILSRRYSATFSLLIMPDRGMGTSMNPSTSDQASPRMSFSASSSFPAANAPPTRAPMEEPQTISMAIFASCSPRMTPMWTSRVQSRFRGLDRFFAVYPAWWVLLHSKGIPSRERLMLTLCSENSR